MKNIEIEDDLYKYILANIEAFGETPSQILRRLLSLPNASPDNATPITSSVTPSAPRQEAVNDESSVFEAVTPKVLDRANISLPEPLAHGVNALFDSEVFKTEAVVTNKFMMLLATMYYENKNAFEDAADKTKGRTRDYLGQNLNALLAADSEEEQNFFKASKPRNIPHTPFWVITNANTGRKRIIITQMMASMGYPHYLIERIKEEI
ncbi:negative regulator of replication initiation SeqA [Psychromonas ingrahamii 37]|uniref:Negative modulator of initiation of replication n=1 Tax=Psychromonas ingrahamii (strain DSM 17664 / CCUG 51855 / 37) TaxID=357804 RepID=SEQA_PSYIN|nr:negative modulator of initiation of replication [Psychromonas ingrahamii]A1STA5.1 RecName: Full=Negative modulator of initiation of replication [Psychromonas ingrahamii 37]ABM02720.1 negative regulator of replication initiation SeqA [Psychromonas ingrahamii 37]